MKSTHASNNTQYSGWKRNLRQSARSGINMHLKILWSVDGEEKIIPGYARNISEGGMAVFIPAQISESETFRVQFTFPGSTEELTVHATVRTVHKFHYGLEFTKFDDKTKHIIAEHCRIALSGEPGHTEPLPR